MTTEPVEPAAPAVTPDPPAQPEPVKETDWKAEARKWEERAKANKDAADKLAQIEEASKSEAEKAAERLAAAEAKAAALEAQAQVATWKDEVAEATGVPAKVLAGSTREEIEAHAAALKSLIVPQDTAATGPYVPSEGSGAGTPSGPAQAFADVLNSQLGH